MSKESYARGFCKAAAAAGVDPVALAKFAYDQKDVEKYRDAVFNAGEDAAKYLTEQEKTQPLPSIDDIRGALRQAKRVSEGYETVDRTVPPMPISESISRASSVNPDWFTRFSSSLGQERIMDKEDMGSDQTTAMRALGRIVGNKPEYFSLRETPEDLFRGAWPALTNAVGYANAPVRPKTQQVVLKKK